MYPLIARIIVVFLLLAPVHRMAGGSTATEPQWFEVNTATDAGDLARGYEDAFKKMSASRVILFVRMEDHIRKIEFIRSIRASGGVLVIEMRDSNILAVDARRVVLMTDGKMEP